MGAMTATRAWTWLLAACGACAIGLLAGCGDDPFSGGSDPGDPEAEGSEPGGADPGAEDDPDAGEDAMARRILDACRRIVDGAPGVPGDVKDDLIAECEAAAEDDEEALRRAAGAACEVIAAATAPGPLRGPVASACRRAIPGSQRL